MWERLKDGRAREEQLGDAQVLGGEQERQKVTASAIRGWLFPTGAWQARLSVSGPSTHIDGNVRQSSYRKRCYQLRRLGAIGMYIKARLVTWALVEVYLLIWDMFRVLLYRYGRSCLS
ncbi:hypothetical protein P171DRAFT_272775 [Karstenula rhodostoma CBS 690.94]|uniref:Uncharacterized protein n=1 Tax=Karstenula rhodostoma CBS 690.94 TaxID=1392251 RepID=A0A9P4PIL5_9PLEO|nr:hypothetical protein P171DRAFT_272775 [Karstenula rhodostoma CBS 690.94]